jgi:hypothetical protein
MMADGKIIDVAVKKTSHSIHLPKQSHQTKSQEFPEHFPCANLVYHMAEGDNLVDNPLDLKLLCLSQLRNLKDRIIKVGI